MISKTQAAKKPATHGSKIQRHDCDSNSSPYPLIKLRYDSLQCCLPRRCIVRVSTRSTCRFQRHVARFQILVDWAWRPLGGTVACFLQETMFVPRWRAHKTCGGYKGHRLVGAKGIGHVDQQPLQSPGCIACRKTVVHCDSEKSLLRGNLWPTSPQSDASDSTLWSSGLFAFLAGGFPTA